MDDALELLSAAVQAGAGWYAVAAACVVLGIRAYRHPAIQGALPKSKRWKSLPSWGRLALVFLSSTGAAVVTSILAGHTLWAALAAAMPVAAAAIGAHESTRAVGYAHTSGKIMQDLAYEPGVLRRAAEPIFPIDRQRLSRAHSIAQRRGVG